MPFYVAARSLTIDPKTPDGAGIPIEERDPGEVTAVLGTAISLAGTAAANFAFDVTPAELITAIITDAGELEPPFGPSVGRALRAAGS